MRCVNPLRQSGAQKNLEFRSTEKDAYYVLYCIGQFELPENKRCFLEALTYGLFKPVRDPVMIEAEHNRTAK